MSRPCNAFLRRGGRFEECPQKFVLLSHTHTMLYVQVTSFSGSGDGFFLVCKDFGRMFDHSLPACAFFLLFKWRLARPH